MDKIKGEREPIVVTFQGYKAIQTLWLTLKAEDTCSLSVYDKDGRLISYTAQERYRIKRELEEWLQKFIKILDSIHSLSIEDK